MSSWGYWDVAPARPTTVRHERLTVFEPGLPESGRRALRLLRNAGVAAGVVGILSTVVFGVPAGLVITGCFITLCAVAARRVRGRSRSLFATVRLGEPNAQSVLIDEVRHRLTLLEAARRDGLLSPVEWEAGCWEVYERIGETGRVVPRR